jgi:hypothetical protein
LSLTPGTRGGVYEILSLIGSGGMGEMYSSVDSSKPAINRQGKTGN